MTTDEERETWLRGAWDQARKLQRPLPSGALQVVHKAALKYLPGVDGIPSGDPLRMSEPKQATLL